jgi:hypothetical protein
MIALLLRLILWSMAAGSTLMFLTLASRRLFYPLELDCIEGVMMDHVVRLSQGQPIYVQPSLSFIPLAYMPTYPAVVSLLARVFGPDFWEGRLISVLAVAGTVALMIKIVRSETESWTLAAAAGAIYLMGFGLTGSCFDVARPDSLMLFFALAGLAMLRFSTGQSGAVGAALFLALAFFTKQHAAWFVLAALLHLLVNERHRVLVFLLWSAVFVGGGFTVLSYWLGPWFSFYVLDVPAHWSHLSGPRILTYLGERLMGTLGVLAGAAVLSLALQVRPWRGRDGLWVWVGLAGIGSGLLATLDPEAYRHVLMPTLLAFSILGPISLHRIATEMTASRTTQLKPTLGVMFGVLALQFLPLVYPMSSHFPRPHAAEARAQFVERLKNRPGTVLVPYHGFYSWCAGKGTSLHIIPLDDLLRAPGNRIDRYDAGFLDRVFEPLRHGENRPAIVTDVMLPSSGRLWHDVDSTYTLSGQLGWLTETLRPVTGNRFTPTFVYVPKTAHAGGTTLGDTAAARDSLLSHAPAPPGEAPHSVTDGAAMLRP